MLAGLQVIIFLLRAPVNKPVVEQLIEIWHKDIIQLNCNVHVMNGFKAGAVKALKVLDKKWSVDIEGRDSSVENFLYGLSKLRLVLMCFYWFNIYGQ